MIGGTLQARIQVLGLEGAKLGEGSGGRLRSPARPRAEPWSGDQGGKAPRKLLQLSDFRA